MSFPMGPPKDLPPSPLANQTVSVPSGQERYHQYLAEVLGHPTYRDIFRQFLCNDHVLAGENIAFWEAVEAYRKNGGGVQAAQEIYDQFIKEGSDFEINIDYHTRREVQNNLSQGNPNHFDDVQTTVFKLIADDKWLAFTKHELYIAFQTAKQPPTQSKNLVQNFAVLMLLLIVLYFLFIA